MVAAAPQLTRIGILSVLACLVATLFTAAPAQASIANDWYDRDQLGTILRARHLILLAFGEGKAHAVSAAVEGPLTASHPASAIQLHPHATVVVDEAAATAFRFSDYYREAQENKPQWQRL